MNKNMNKKLLALLLIAPLFTLGSALAEDARVAVPDTAVSSGDDDCDDADRACSPQKPEATVLGPSAETSTLDSSSSVGGVDQDCDGDACAPTGTTTDPAGMAINEKGLPGKKSSNKDTK